MTTEQLEEGRQWPDVYVTPPHIVDYVMGSGAFLAARLCSPPAMEEVPMPIEHGSSCNCYMCVMKQAAAARELRAALDNHTYFERGWVCRSIVAGPFADVPDNAEDETAIRAAWAAFIAATDPAPDAGRV